MLNVSGPKKEEQFVIQHNKKLRDLDGPHAFTILQCNMFSSGCQVTYALLVSALSHWPNNGLLKHFYGHIPQDTGPEDGYRCPNIMHMLFS